MNPKVCEGGVQLVLKIRQSLKNINYKLFAALLIFGFVPTIYTTVRVFFLVRLLVGFYVLYAVQNVFDATFYGMGKTEYIPFESVVTNSIYYGIAFVLYVTGVWIPTLTGIALLFGIGNAFDSVVSLRTLF